MICLPWLERFAAGLAGGGQRPAKPLGGEHVRFPYLIWDDLLTRGGMRSQQTAPAERLAFRPPANELYYPLHQARTTPGRWRYPGYQRG